MGRYNAIMTDTDREHIKSEAKDNTRYQAVSRVRSRINEELPKDVEILREYHPELYTELREVVCE